MVEVGICYGTYGVSIGGAFFAESMFHTMTNASKVALYYLVERMKHRGMALLEVQFLTPHLASLGAVEISKLQYLVRLRDALKMPVSFGDPQRRGEVKSIPLKDHQISLGGNDNLGGHDLNDITLTDRSQTNKGKGD